MAKLVYTEGGIEQEFVLDQGRAAYTIGRNPMCDLRINNPSISRKHAEVRVDAATGRYSVHDLNSSNGTYVNGARLQHADLNDGDEVLCGEFEIVFHATDVRSRTGSVPPAPPSQPPPGSSSPNVTRRGDALADSRPIPQPSASGFDSALGDDRRLLPASELQRELGAARAELKSLRLALQNESARAAEAVQEQTKLSKNLARAREELAEAQSAKDAPDSHGDLRAADARIADLEAQLRDAKLAADGRQKLQDEVTALREQLAAAPSAADLATLRDELEAARAANGSAGEIAQQLAEAREERDAARAHADELASRVEQVAEARDGLEEEVERLREAAATAASEQLDATLAEADIAARDAEITALTERVATLEKLVDDLRSALADTTAERDDLRAKSVSMKEAFKDLSGELQDLIQANRALMAKADG